MFKLGLVVNPYAGVGGPLALKGSDDTQLVIKSQHQAVTQPQLPSKIPLAEQGLSQHPALRATQALSALIGFNDVVIYCYAGAMGEDIARPLGFNTEVVGKVLAQHSTADDTVNAAQALQQEGVDVIVFVGGDGTARDMFRAVGSQYPVLGIPAGVKMHSGVYAVSPQAAGEILCRMVGGKLVDIGLAEVRDIDEDAFRKGAVRSRFYGELLVPRCGHFLQQVKSSGREVEELVVQDIAADIIESMEDNCLYLVGPGTTPSGVLQQLNLNNTLLGIDAIYNGQLVQADLNEQQILALLLKYPSNAKIIITAIGGQGHILGRGNQQLSPSVIRAVGIEHIIIVATKTKITELNTRPLLVDSGDVELDKKLSGFRQIITGYHDSILYEVSDGSNAIKLND